MGNDKESDATAINAIGYYNSMKVLHSWDTIKYPSTSVVCYKNSWAK